MQLLRGVVADPLIKRNRSVLPIPRVLEHCLGKPAELAAVSDKAAHAQLFLALLAHSPLPQLLPSICGTLKCRQSRVQQ